jgi:hypothetical protein
MPGRQNLRTNVSGQVYCFMVLRVPGTALASRAGGSPSGILDVFMVSPSPAFRAAVRCR